MPLFKRNHNTKNNENIRQIKEHVGKYPHNNLEIKMLGKKALSTNDTNTKVLQQAQPPSKHLMTRLPGFTTLQNECYKACLLEAFPNTLSLLLQGQINNECCLEASVIIQLYQPCSLQRRTPQ